MAIKVSILIYLSAVLWAGLVAAQAHGLVPAWPSFVAACIFGCILGWNTGRKW